MNDIAKPASVRPLRARFVPMKWALLIYMVFEVLLCLANTFELYTLQVDGIDPYQSDGPAYLAFMLFALFTGIGYTIIYILCVVFVCLWTFRAMKNLHLVGSPLVEMSPGWAVGWYFIPFANFFKPYSGMTQIWAGSSRAVDENSQTPAMLGWWWGLWVVLNILGNISLRLGGLTGEGAGYVWSLGIDIVTAPFLVVCAWLLLKVTSNITRKQKALEGYSIAETF